jgi:hypothetical protein
MKPMQSVTLQTVGLHPCRHTSDRSVNRNDHADDSRHDEATLATLATEGA